MGPALWEGLARKLRGKYDWKAKSRPRAAGAPREQSDSAGGWQKEHRSVRAAQQEKPTASPEQSRGGSGSLQLGFKNCSSELSLCQRANQGTQVRSRALPMSPCTVPGCSLLQGAGTGTSLPRDVGGDECTVRWRDLGLTSLEKG